MVRSRSRSSVSFTPVSAWQGGAADADPASRLHPNLGGEPGRQILPSSTRETAKKVRASDVSIACSARCASLLSRLSLSASGTSWNRATRARQGGLVAGGARSLARYARCLRIATSMHFNRRPPIMALLPQHIRIEPHSRRGRWMDRRVARVLDTRSEGHFLGAWVRSRSAI